MKIFTCTPVRFKGDHTFFARDSGLLCKGFQAIGVHSRAVMPGPPMDDDQAEDLIRTEYLNLEDPEWWKAQNIDAVVFYAWGLGRYRKIASAIRKAELGLLCSMDTGGMLGIITGFDSYRQMLLNIARYTHGPGIKCYCIHLIQFAYSVIVLPVKLDFFRALHLRHATIIGAITPIAVDRIRKACQIYGGKELASRVQLIPHPMASYLKYDGSVQKIPSVIVVGRWSDRVKDPDLLLEIVDLVCTRNMEIAFHIVGEAPDAFLGVVSSLNEKHGGRIRAHGRLKNTAVKHLLESSQVSLCCSMSEGFHLSSGEALCCGCSIVGPNTDEIPSMDWFARPPHGTCSKRSADELSEAVIEELVSWKNGKRNPHTISDKWTSILHTEKVAQLILEKFRSE